MAGKTLYHSALVGMGEVAIIQKSIPRASKFPGKPKYVTIEINGEEHNYNCENVHGCEVFFSDSNNIGRAMVIQALGTREEAVINFIGDVETVPTAQHAPTSPQARQAPARATTAPPARAAAPAPRPAPAAPPPAPAAPAQQAAKPPTRKGPSKEDQAAKLKEVKLLAAKLANICQISRTAAEHAAEMFKAQRDTTIGEDQVQSWTASIFIQIVRDGHQNGMPSGIIPIGTPPAPIPGEADPGEQGTEEPDDVQV